MSKSFCTFIVIGLLLNTFKPLNSVNWPDLNEILGMCGDILVAVNTVTLALTLYKTNQDPIHHYATIQNHTNNLQGKLDKINSNISGVKLDFAKLMRGLPQILQQQHPLSDLQKHLVRLKSLYEDYEHYSDCIKHFNKHTLLDFALEVTSSVEDLLDQIHALVVPPNTGWEKNDLLSLAAVALTDLPFTEQCKLNQSPSQIILNIFSYIAIAKAQSFVMTLFAYSLLKLYTKGNYDHEVEVFEKKFIKHFLQELKIFQNISQPLSREVWKCDPYVHVKEKTYIEVTGFQQGYILNEELLNHEGSCRDDCNKYKLVKGPKLSKHKKECRGNLTHCKKFVGQIKKICYSNNYSRRYQGIAVVKAHVYFIWHFWWWQKHWLTDGFHYYYGKLCGNSFFEELHDYVRKNYLCEYCFCLCDEEEIFSDRVFNLRPLMANYKHNRVVTGLRFVKRNRIIHLQIQEGKLLPSGSIDFSTVRWVPVEDYKLNDTDITKGVDYYVLSNDHRNVFLDDLVAHEGHVLTGVRFISERPNLMLSIAVTPFNVTKGRLNIKVQQPQWIDNKHIIKRKQLHIHKPDSSIVIRSASVEVKTKKPAFVQFRTTDFQKDANQLTVPTIDAQSVVSSRPAVLEGAGIYYKTQPKYGGFLALKIMTYNYNQHGKV